MVSHVSSQTRVENAPKSAETRPVPAHHEAKTETRSTPLPKDTVHISKAANQAAQQQKETAAQEATESAATTAQEAASGDAQAARAQARQAAAKVSH